VTYSSLSAFKRRFPEVVAIVRGSRRYHIDIVEPHASTGSADPIVFFRHENGRSFGAVWSVADRVLIGLRSRTYDPARGADGRANGEFLEELRRRLSTNGESYEEIADRSAWKWGIEPPHVRQALQRRAF
jgi:hypothetical protein